MKVKVSVAQLCPALHDSMDCSLPGSSVEFFVHEILQAKILERVAMPPPGDLPDPGLIPLTSPALAGRFLASYWL